MELEFNYHRLGDYENLFVSWCIMCCLTVRTCFPSHIVNLCIATSARGSDFFFFFGYGHCRWY